MRYFTIEIIRALSGDPEGAEEWANEEWANRIARYREELERIRPQLPERLAAFIDSGSLYEYHLERLTIGGSVPDPVIEVRNSLEVELQLSFGDDVRRLLYKNVHHIGLTLDDAFPLLRRVEPPHHLLTDTWLYDEISLATRGRARHQVLLASGGVLTIDFENFDFFVSSNELRTEEFEIKNIEAQSQS